MLYGLFVLTLIFPSFLALFAGDHQRINSLLG
jgi:hypothetical protein